jgi:uncharacterized protein YjbJ (UPF0337 family)
MWNRDEIRGHVDQASGKVKEAVGKATNDEDLRNQGEAEHAAGHVEEVLGKGRRKVGEAIEDLGDKLSK